ncbi:MAG: hypothetical protein KAJ19_02745 [Gammaproteobacteria bacterium]|nr:hypothetical protein [Gammaproteobacteria bacterium]
MSGLNIAVETAKLIADMAIKVTYREGRLCSCVGENHGSYDAQDDCIDGFRHKDPVEYNLLRTSIDMKRVSEKAGMILQGGCQMTIPRLQIGHHAVFVGTKDLSNGIDLSANANIKIGLDGGTETEISMTLLTADPTDVSIAEIVRSINTASNGLGEIAYESGVDGDPNGSGYISLRSLAAGTGSSIVFVTPDGTDGTGEVFGLAESHLPYRFTPSKTVYQYLPIYEQVSRGDVIVINARSTRDNSPMKRGTLDRIKAFDIERIVSVAERGTFYYENIDFTFDGSIITWLAGKGPAVGARYNVEFLGKPNYIVYEELSSDRGADDDVVAKKIHLALRNYVESGIAMDLPIDRRNPAFSTAFSTAFQIGN